MVIGAKYHSNSAYPPKFLVQFEAKYSPQIAPEAVSEHGYVKNFLVGGGGGGRIPPDPPILLTGHGQFQNPIFPK